MRNIWVPLTYQPNAAGGVLETDLFSSGFVAHCFDLDHPPPPAATIKTVAQAYIMAQHISQLMAKAD